MVKFNNYTFVEFSRLVYMYIYDPFNEFVIMVNIIFLQLCLLFILVYSSQMAIKETDVRHFADIFK